MSQRVLVVEDDPNIADVVADTLLSLGMEHDWVGSQEEARPKVQAGGYACVLLDLQIPARAGRGLASVQYGVNMAREIHQSPAMHGVPVIVMTAYGKEGLEAATTLSACGVREFINKPFPASGRTLASVIQSVLDRTRPAAGGPAHSKVPPRPFQGGELVFLPDRVELCQIKIAGAAGESRIRAILDALRARRANGRFVIMTGNELADATECAGGENSVAAAIRDFRTQLAELLGKEQGLVIGPQDVVRSGGPGYRLHESMTVRDAVPSNASASSDGRPISVLPHFP